MRIHFGQTIDLIGTTPRYTSLSEAVERVLAAPATASGIARLVSDFRSGIYADESLDEGGSLSLGMSVSRPLEIKPGEIQVLISFELGVCLRLIQGISGKITLDRSTDRLTFSGVAITDKEDLEVSIPERQHILDGCAHLILDLVRRDIEFSQSDLRAELA